VAGADPVAVLTTSLAQRVFGDENPLGQRLTLHLGGGNGEGETGARDFTVIGVTAEVAGPFLESDTDNVFLPYWQEPGPVLTVAVRATSEDEALGLAVGEAFVSLDPALAAPAVRPFAVVIQDRGRDMPVWSVFFTVISTLLLALSALGIYGIVAFAVANRTREIGVRMSLGSSRRAVLEGVIKDAVKLAAPGLVVGSALGLLVGQAVLNRMYAQIGLPMADAYIMFAAAAGALGVVVAASVSPARKAASVDPMEALRAE
jgi:putative ABC transport system permease protein